MRDAIGLLYLARRVSRDSRLKVKDPQSSAFVLWEETLVIDIHICIPNDKPAVRVV